MNESTKIKFLLGIIGVLIIVIIFGLVVRQTGPTPPKVVVVQNKPQEWADALKLGLHDGLRDEGLKEGIDVVVVPRSAAGDPQGLTGLAEAIARQDAAVVYTLGTQATQTVFRAVRDKPIVFGAVTDPIKAGFFDGSLDKPKGDITGTQDLWPYPAQVDLLVQLVPRAKKIGIVYNASEINAQVSVEHIKNESVKRNLQLLERTVTEEAQIPAAVAGLINAGIDAFFIPADNTAQTSAQTIITACMRKLIPVFTGIPGIVEKGALGTVGTNYYELGRVNAWQIAQILNGTPASKVPIRIAEKGDLYLNLVSAKLLGIAVPEEQKKHAFKLYE